MSAFFRSGDRVYEMVGRDTLSLRDVITFPRDAAEVLGHDLPWAEFEDLAHELDALPEEERRKHPMGPFVLAVSVWASRRAAGDLITFGQCLDEPFEWVSVKQPGDRQPGKQKGPKKGPKKKRPTSTRTSAPVAADQPSEPTA